MRRAVKWFELSSDCTLGPCSLQKSANGEHCRPCKDMLPNSSPQSMAATSARLLARSALACGLVYGYSRGKPLGRPGLRLSIGCCSYDGGATIAATSLGLFLDPGGLPRLGFGGSTDSSFLFLEPFGRPRLGFGLGVCRSYGAPVSVCRTNDASSAPFSISIKR
jgi:hypothetical protein